MVQKRVMQNHHKGTITPRAEALTKVLRHLQEKKMCELEGN